MEKRGLSGHVDWIIGISLFLISVGFIITLFRPGVTPLHSGNVLLDIAEQGFFNNTNIEFNKAPIFIESVKYCIENDNGGCEEKPLQSVNDAAIFLGGGKDDPEDVIGKNNKVDAFYESLDMLKNENIETFFVVNNNNGLSNSVPGLIIEPEASNGYDGFEEEAAIFNDLRDIGEEFPKLVSDDERNSIKFFWDEASKKFYVAGKLIVDPNTNTRIKTKEFIIYGNKENTEILNLGQFLTQPNPSSVITACIIENREDTVRCRDGQLCCKARYEVGAIEKIRGLSIQKFTNLRKAGSSDLQGLKESWGFPANREFKITISGEDKNGKKFNLNENTDYKSFVFPERPIPNNVNVFARRFSSFLINDDGERIPVTVMIQVW